MTRLELAQKYMKGSGLEIGPSSSPWPNPNNARMEYCDKRTTEEIKKTAPAEFKDKVPEIEFVGDGTSCTGVDGRYDFVVSSHVFEHLPNPLLAIQNWIRILKPEGLIIMAVPEKTQTFDKDRALTVFGHLARDYFCPEWNGSDGPELHFHVWDKDTLRGHLTIISEIFCLDIIEFEFVVFECFVVLRRQSATIQKEACSH